MDAETPPKKITLTRHKLIRLADKSEARASYKELADLATKNKPPSKTPRALALSELHVAPFVFQWRTIVRQAKTDSEQHTLNLARALQDSDAPFGPLLIYLIGGKYYVLDGHHRLDAYHSVRWSKKVPVTVFSGALEEARSKALELNSRDKLAMTHIDKLEAAWDLTKTTNLSIAEVNKLSTASKRTISYMRRAWKRLCGQFRKEGSKQANKEAGALQYYKSIAEMRERLTWVSAKGALLGIEFTPDKEWYDHAVEEMTGLLGTHVGFKLLRHPDVTADALRKLHPRLPRELIREWAVAEWETIKELVEEREEEIGDF
jgi:hypothetical protein